MASAGLSMMRAQYLDLFESRLPYLNEILFRNFNAPELKYTRVFNVQDSARAYEEKTGITGFGLFGKKAENEKVDYDVRLQAYDKRLTHETWGKGYQFTFEMMRDDLDAIVRDTAPELARAALNSIETDAFADFNNAFGSTTTPDGGGTALISASHSLVGGGSFSNLITGDLGQGTIQSALNKFADMRDERNLLIRGQADILLIPTELQWTAAELLDSQQRSDTANNAINVIQRNRVGLETIVSPYLTDANAWFILSDPSQHNLVYYWRDEPFTDSALDFDTRNMKTAMLYSMSHGAFDWRNIVGSAGAS